MSKATVCEYSITRILYNIGTITSIGCSNEYNESGKCVWTIKAEEDEEEGDEKKSGI